jgi:hypothetical protein
MLDEPVPSPGVDPGLVGKLLEGEAATERGDLDWGGVHLNLQRRIFTIGGDRRRLDRIRCKSKTYLIELRIIGENDLAFIQCLLCVSQVRFEELYVSSQGSACHAEPG